MNTTKNFSEAIAACLACASACERSAAACLKETNVHALEDCIAINTDCAEICKLTAVYLERDRKAAMAMCNACADVCTLCQEVCDTYQLDYCKACADACRICIEACRALVGNVERAQHSHDSVIAGLRQ